MHSESSIGFATSKPFLQWLCLGFIFTHPSEGSSSKFIIPTSSFLQRLYIFFSLRTSDVSGGPLLSPMVILFAPIFFKCNIRLVSVSLWVEPGKWSAVLKFGLSKTFFFFTVFTPRMSIAFLMPDSLSEVFTRETFDFLFSRDKFIGSSLADAMFFFPKAIADKAAPAANINSRLFIIYLPIFIFSLLFYLKHSTF